MIIVVHPGSASQIQIQIFYPTRIPAPVVKKAPDPGSGSATLTDCQTFSILCFRFHKIYSPEEALSQILERDDIFIYETPPPPPPSPVVTGVQYSRPAPIELERSCFYPYSFTAVNGNCVFSRNFFSTSSKFLRFWTRCAHPFFKITR
jgi:hypothetical protein